MGKLVNGEWDPSPARGHDQEDSFDGWVEPPQNDSAAHPAAQGRYHLYISRACPWAHRAALVRRLKGLEDVISVDVVDPVREDDGWEFTPEKDNCTPDRVTGAQYLRDVYTNSDPLYTGRVTVPVLYDTTADTIVNNESADIARMLNRAFDEFGDRNVELYPKEHRDEIDDVANQIHQDVNLGVYRAGFADSQEAYEEAVQDLFEAMEHWDRVLDDRRFLVGDIVTLADVFLFPTLFRFDAVYHTHFKCTVKRLVDFENLWDYARDIYQLPRVAETCNIDHVKAHYYRSHEDLNPTGFVPVGPELDWSRPTAREELAEGQRTPFLEE